MKRTIILLWLTIATLCANAQFKSAINAGTDENGEQFQVSLNLDRVCRSIGAKPEELGHVLKVWLDPSRTWKWPEEYKEYEALPLMYLITADGTETSVGDNHANFALKADGTPGEELNENMETTAQWTCQISTEPEQNKLNFTLLTMTNLTNGQPMVKAGDVCHAVFGMEYQGRKATFDITMNIVEGHGGRSLPLMSFEKVGEERLAMQYKQGKECKAKFDLMAIARQFGEDVKSDNLQLYVAEKGNPQRLTDRYAYCEAPIVNYNEAFADEPDYGESRCVRLHYAPQLQEIQVMAVTDGYAAGEHAAGTMYLVADGKYYALNVDVQVGDSEQEAKNMAVVETAELCGTFLRTISVKPMHDKFGDAEEVVASFNISMLAKALNVDAKTLYDALESWSQSQERPDGTEMLYNLSDHASTAYNGGCGNFQLKKNGMVSREEKQIEWMCRMQMDSELNELQFELYQQPGALKDGDACHAALGLCYEGRMVTLDLTMNIRGDGRGNLVALGGMKKVGEETVSGKLNYTNGLRKTLNLAEIASHFGSGVEGKSLKLYVMADTEKQMLTDRHSYELAPSATLDIECTELQDCNTMDYFCVNYAPYPEVLLITAPADAFKGGQHSSGSIFLVDGDEYYELVLDIQFGEESDALKSLDIVGTESIDVKLMVTDNCYTYYDKENDSYALVSTTIDVARVAELLGTESPKLYAEQMDGEGGIVLTSRYNCAPGQGFWFEIQNGQAYRTTQDDIEHRRFGMYYSSGMFKWYEMPFPPAQAGDKYSVNLYLANPARSTAVKYEIEVEIVKEIETPSIAYIHRLPQGLSAVGGANSIQNAEFKMQNETDAVYDLQGRRLNAVPEKGMYIQGGRKKMK